jgi:uncharacterized protein YjbJ (UPF0337 family)
MRVPRCLGASRIEGVQFLQTTTRCDQPRSLISFQKSLSDWHAICSRSIGMMGGYAMNWDRIEGNWKQFKGQIRQRWGKLTDDDMDVIAGKRDVLVGKVQERQGIARDEAERQVDEWTAQL